MVHNVTLSRLYCVLGDFRKSTDTLVQNFPCFLISTIVPLALNAYKITLMEWFAKQSIPLQLRPFSTLLSAKFSLLRVH